MGAFFHAVGVFFQHLAEVKWEALGLALACQAVKLGFRSYAWRSILRAAYPAQRLKLRSVFGAYVAGVGVNAIVPARAGDVVKMYLVKQRLQDASYATLAPTLLVETLFDFVVATGLLIWALSLGVLPTNQVYAKLPTVDWQFFVRHDRFSLILLVALFVAALVGIVWARMRWREFKQRVGMGFAILRDRPRFLRSVIVPQAISWVFRIAGLFFFLQAFGVHASLHNALLAQVVDSLATLFPATPGGAGTKQGLIVYLFRHQAVSRALLLAFSVGMNIALVVENLVLGFLAVGLMTRNFSFKRLRAASRADDAPPAQDRGTRRPDGLRVRLPARHRTGSRPPLHVRGRRRCDRRRDRAGAVRALAGARDRRLARRERAGRRQGQAGRCGDRPGVAVARRARTVARRLLRLDACPRARAGRARDAQAAQGAEPPGRPAGARRRGGRTRALAAAGRRRRADRGRRRRGRRNFLLHGATGSGKTEVYLQACAAVLERGLGAIVLVPEIALALQTVGRVRARFGDSVAILHSGFTDAERRDERERIANGTARIVVGARSAVFAPVPGLGLIVVDEEHDASYKQDSDPRYDARTVAAKRATLEGAVAVFGSATPRPESWAALEHLSLGGRIGADLPPVRVVDLRREAGYPLSAPLLAELRAVAERRGKAILMLNRRGVAPALHCRACGTTIRCPNCDVALVLHGDSELRCHHCGFAQGALASCPVCESPDLARLGAGTQKLERELARELPDLELIRLDGDAVSSPEALAALLRRFADTPGSVLLGTQMVAKGHHFSGVELAAVIDADTGLGLPDFRAEERTFQLITQLAGRSGRDAPGQVLVQTFQPDARPIVHAARHDVERFLTEELARRRELGYPPFKHLVRIVVSGPALEDVLRALGELKAGIRGVELLGPAPLPRLRNRHRAQLVAKTGSPRALASQAARLLQAASPALRKAGLTAVVDVDPQSV